MRDPVTGQAYSRDSRYIAQKAEAYLKSSGIGETAYIGPEAEFFIFDDVRYGQGTNFGFYEVDSAEGNWNSGVRNSTRFAFGSGEYIGMRQQAERLRCE